MFLSGMALIMKGYDSLKSIVEDCKATQNGGNIKFPYVRCVILHPEKLF
jgi:hypothetical protein